MRRHRWSCGQGSNNSPTPNNPPLLVSIHFAFTNNENCPRNLSFLSNAKTFMLIVSKITLHKGFYIQKSKCYRKT